MPNVNGLYQLQECEDRVRRLLDQIQAQVDMTTGAETSPVIQSQAFSNTDIDQHLNASLVKLYNEVVVIAIAYMRQYFEQASVPATITIPPELANPTDYVSELTIPTLTNVSFPASINFARVIQQGAIYDAAYSIAVSRQMELTQAILQGRTEWHTLLVDTATNAFKNAVYLTAGIGSTGGLYNLAALEDRVFRLLKSIQEVPAVGTDGAAVSKTFPSYSFSTVDVDNQINAALVKLYNEVVVIAIAYMRQYFEQAAMPAVIAIPAALVNPADLVTELTIPTLPNVSFPASTSFARIIQEACVYDATIVLATVRGMNVTPQFEKSKLEWHTLLTDAATNAFKNPVYLTPGAATDNLGRYNLASMEDRVFRLLKKIQETPAANPDGAVTSKTYPSISFSQTDVDNQINASLVGLYTEIAMDAQEQFTQTFFISVGQNNPGPYAFPPRMLQLRFMEWLPPGLQVANARPEQWVPMNYMSDPLERQMTHDYRGPTWQYDSSGTAFILNRNPDTANPSGVRVKCVVLPPPLVNPTDVILARFAVVMQEAVIYDAAWVLGNTRPVGTMGKDLVDGRQEWHQRLVTTANNAYHQESVAMVSPRIPVQSFSGRRHRGTRGRW